MGDLFDNYALSGAYDEMLVAPDDARPHNGPLYETLRARSPDDLELRCQARDRVLRDEGITFSFLGEERPFPLDLVPRVIPASEWAVIERGVQQRVRALEAFLADVYDSEQILGDGVVPAGLVKTSPHFLREAHGVAPPNGVRVHVGGIDLVRGADGRYVVLEDNVRVPSGVSYVIENRRLMTTVFPELFGDYRVRPVDTYPAHLREALRRAAPAGIDNPTVVVLTPGVHNSAYFEHAFLARQLGVELVEGSDLICRANTIYMRTTAGERRVDVIYRRVDDEFLDPLQFRPDSLLGCPGLVNAARAGNVAIANGLGTGVADDKAVYPYVGDMIRYYFDEEPILDSVPTFRLYNPDELDEALRRMDELVWKPVGGSGGHGLVIGPQADRATLEELRGEVLADPRGWIAQDMILLSTVPSLVDGRLRPRHVDLRPFSVNDGERVWVVPGGLTRVALREGSMVVNSSQGGGSKDTWVLATSSLSPPAEDLVGWGAGAVGFTRGIAPQTGPVVHRPVTSDSEQQQ